MSYILDALKKIEHEKSKKTYPDGRINISGDLFQERNRPTARAGIWKTVAIVAVASLLACAGTWFMLQGNSKKSTVVIRPVAPPPPAPASVNPPIATPAIPVPVQPQPTPVVVPPAASPAAAPVSPQSAESDEDDDSSARSARRSRNRIKAQSPSPTQPAQTAQAPADIKLSGIAWQDERRARRAVVNGFLLKEGAVVSGAKIIDIKADTVRFSSPAGVFEIKLDAVLPAEMKK